MSIEKQLALVIATVWLSIGLVDCEFTQRDLAKHPVPAVSASPSPVCQESSFSAQMLQLAEADLQNAIAALHDLEIGADEKTLYQCAALRVRMAAALTEIQLARTAARTPRPHSPQH